VARSPSPDLLAGENPPAFELRLDNFEGPFDLLLSLISKHELDITDIALSKVTDEFIGFLRGLDSAEELDRASEFLVVAATLLDLKIVGLLPQGELVDAEDVALLEARDLLFARLLQYRAFKEVAQWFGDSFDAESTRHVRQVRLEEKYRRQTPELVWTLTPDDFAARAAGEHPGAGRPCRDSSSIEWRPGLVPAAHRRDRREGGRRRTVPRGARAVSACVDLFRADRTARRVDPQLDGGVVDRGEPL
jgi:hypothetical protein